ncbi:MAG: hypothetical protein HRU20_21375 [Pseudomonadales bacterium]|nr:hypothetical protein [Pseudomonadales bacterium]
MRYTRLFTIVAAALLTACSNYMVLRPVEITDYPFDSSLFPTSYHCTLLKQAYDDGKDITLQKGLRWITTQEPGDNYTCKPGKNCINIHARVTTLDKDQAFILKECRMEASQAFKIRMPGSNMPQTRIIPTSIPVTNDPNLSTALATIAAKLNNISNSKKPFTPLLSQNLSSFVAMLIHEADVSDMIGYTVLGINPRQSFKIPNPSYAPALRVEKIEKDRVLLHCRNCNMPTIAIKRVKERPTPVEGQNFNDTRAVYRFLGAKQIQDKNGESKQILVFERIPLTQLGLSKDHLFPLL